MTSDDLEFSIVQYLDGDLAAGERRALEARLASDAEARQLLDHHRHLLQVLKAAPMPNVRWDALADHLSEAISRAEEPAQSYSIASWLRPARMLAVAASVLVAFGIALKIYLSVPSPQSPVSQPGSHPLAVIEITGPRAEVAAGPAEVQISIGPARQMASAADASRYSDELVTRPSRLVIASGVNPVQDISGLPY